jgi:deoxyribonuclease-4
LKLPKLFFGTAGIPISTEPRNTIEGIKQVNSLGLGCMELEFVRSVNISKEKAPEVRKTAEDSNVLLTCHGQYYINLNSLEKLKLKASIERVLNAARIAWQCGAFSMTFHAGFYMGQSPADVYKKIKKVMAEIVETLKKEKNKIWVRPETTGKPTQFGSLKEILDLSQELEQVMPCIDFSHLHARTGGKLNSAEDFKKILGDVEKALGKTGLNNMHIHVSGIEYGLKGEKRHLILKDSDMKYKELLKAFKEFNIKGAVISESPNIEGDALLMKKEYEKL